MSIWAFSISWDFRQFQDSRKGQTFSMSMYVVRLLFDYPVGVGPGRPFTAFWLPHHTWRPLRSFCIPWNSRVGLVPEQQQWPMKGLTWSLPGFTGSSSAPLRLIWTWLSCALLAWSWTSLPRVYGMLIRPLCWLTYGMHVPLGAECFKAFLFSFFLTKKSRGSKPLESIPSRHGPASTLQPQKYHKSQQSFQARQARPPCQYLHFHRSSPCLPWSWGKHEASQIESWNVCTRVAVCRQIHHFCILRRKTAKDTWHLRSASSQAVCSFHGLSCFLSGVQEATSAAAIGCGSKPRAIEALEKALQPACWFHCDFTAFQNRCS